MYMEDGLHLSGKGAAVFADGLTAAVDSGMGSITNRSIVNKKNELNIMIEDIDPHLIGIIESWANTHITDA